MVDGTVCNALSNTSSRTCCIYGAKSTEMNNIEECPGREVKEKYFEFGLSPLHSYIRFFEYFLHISYKIEVKVRQVRSAELKLNIMKKKNSSRISCKNGTFNDTSRKFFSNPSLASEIRGIAEY